MPQLSRAQLSKAMWGARTAERRAIRLLVESLLANARTPAAVEALGAVLADIDQRTMRDPVPAFSPADEEGDVEVAPPPAEAVAAVVTELPNRERSDDEMMNDLVRGRR